MIHTLYALVQKPPHQSHSGRISTVSQQNLCFRLANSERELWDAIEEEKFLGSAHDRRSLKAMGWRAVPVQVVVGD